MLTVQVLGIYGSQVDLLGLGWRPVYLLTGLAGVAIAPLLACQGGPALQPPPVMTLCTVQGTRETAGSSRARR